MSDDDYQGGHPGTFEENVAADEAALGATGAYKTSPDAYKTSPDAYDQKKAIRQAFKTSTPDYSGRANAARGQNGESAVFFPPGKRYTKYGNGVGYPWVGSAQSDDMDGFDVALGAPGNLPGNVPADPQAIENLAICVSGQESTLDIAIDGNGAYFNFGQGSGNSAKSYTEGPSIAMEADSDGIQIVLTNSGSSTVNINANDDPEVLLSESGSDPTDGNYLDILLDSDNNHFPKILLNCSCGGSTTLDFDSSGNPEIDIDDGNGNTIKIDTGSGSPEIVLDDSNGNTIKSYIQSGDPQIEIQTESGYSINLNGGCPSIEVNNGCTLTSISPTGIIINENSAGGHGEVDIDSDDITSEAKFRSVMFVSSVVLSGTGCGCVTTKTGYFLCTDPS